MRTALLLLLCIGLFTSAQAQLRTLGAFDEVSISGNVQATLIPSDISQIDIKMLKGDIDDLIVENKKNKLTVKFKSKWLGMNKGKAKVKIYYTALEEVSGSAGARITAEEAIQSASLEVDASSGSSISLAYEGGSAEVDASSGASVDLSGTASSIEAEASSGSSIRAKELICKDGDADVSSGASIQVYTSRSIKAEASSGGSITYYGQPKETKVDASRYSGGSIQAK